MTRRYEGLRVYDKEILEPGEYGQHPIDGRWMCCPPIVLDGEWPHQFMGDLSKHTVEEHENGTITVSPSIMITTHRNDCEVKWHGWLERGVWREAD